MGAAKTRFVQWTQTRSCCELSQRAAVAQPAQARQRLRKLTHTPWERELGFDDRLKKARRTRRLNRGHTRSRSESVQKLRKFDVFFFHLFPFFVFEDGAGPANDALLYCTTYPSYLPNVLKMILWHIVNGIVNTGRILKDCNPQLLHECKTGYRKM